MATIENWSFKIGHLSFVKTLGMTLQPRSERLWQFAACHRQGGGRDNQ
jgi:hypothetical protein